MSINHDFGNLNTSSGVQYCPNCGQWHYPGSHQCRPFWYVDTNQPIMPQTGGVDATRISILEARITELEKRIGELEAQSHE